MLSCYRQTANKRSSLKAAVKPDMPLRQRNPGQGDVMVAGLAERDVLRCYYYLCKYVLLSQCDCRFFYWVLSVLFVSRMWITWLVNVYTTLI